MDIRVEPATADRWADLVQVFGRRGDDPSWCWCRLFLPPSPLDNRAALHEEIRLAEVPPGLVAYAEDRPVGWTRIGPRRDFPRISANRALTRVLDPDDGVWWVTCFAVDSGHRRTGVGRALLAAAVTLARDNGARAVEGHPVDVAGLTADRVGGSALFTGTRAMFAAAGFVEIGRTYRTRPVMRMDLSGAG